MVSKSLTSLPVSIIPAISTLSQDLIFDAEDAVQAGIELSFDADDAIRAGIAVEFISEPINPLAYHIGQGSVLVQWDVPCFGNPGSYEFAVSFDKITWFAWGQVIQGNRSATLVNLPVSSDLYIKMRAVSTGNTPGVYADVLKGKITPVTARILATSIRTSVIPANAVFPVYNESTNSIIAFKAPTTDTVIE